MEEHGMISFLKMYLQKEKNYLRQQRTRILFFEKEEDN